MYNEETEIIAETETQGQEIPEPPQEPEPRLEPNSAKPIAPKGRMIGESANDDLSN